MRESDRPLFSMMLDRLARVFNRKMDAEVAEEYWKTLQGYSLETVEGMMREARDRERFMPVPARLCDMLHYIPTRNMKKNDDAELTPDERRTSRLRAAYWLQYYTWNRPEAAMSHKLTKAAADEQAELTRQLTPEGSNQFVKDNWDNPQFAKETVDENGEIVTVLISAFSPARIPQGGRGRMALHRQQPGHPKNPGDQQPSRPHEQPDEGVRRD